MAYSPKTTNTLPVPVEPAVLSIHLVGPDTATTDQAVSIPWKDCRLTYAYTVTTVAEGNQGAVGIDFELDAADGSAIGTITVAQNSAVGDIAEIASIDDAYANNLDRADTSRDAINVEVTCGATTTWQGTLFMYFERNQ